MPNYMEMTKRTLTILREGTLIGTDGIINLSLMRKGTRPPPGVRRGWRKGVRERLWTQQRGRCVYCGARVELRPYETQIDHLDPVARGGENEDYNLQLTCRHCNNRKGDRTDEEFRFRLRSLLNPAKGSMPRGVISQDRIVAAMAATTDRETYTRWKQGKYLTAAQKVRTGAIVTGSGVFSLFFFPTFFATNPEDSSVLLLMSGAIGLGSGAWVWIRAKLMGRDQD